MRGIGSIAVAALLVAAACGGGSSASEPSAAPAQTAAVATLPTATSPSATLPPTTRPSATPAASSAATGLVAAGKRVYETAGDLGCADCHQASGRGGKTAAGDTAPDIRGATLTKVKDALAGGAAAMAFLKLTDQEIEAVVAYLNYLNGLP